jgi:hypothetical protein
MGGWNLKWRNRRKREWKGRGRGGEEGMVTEGKEGKWRKARNRKGERGAMVRERKWRGGKQRKEGRKGSEKGWREGRGERKKGRKKRKGGRGEERFMCVVWRKPYKYVSIIKKQLCNRRREIRAGEGGNIRYTLSWVRVLVNQAAFANPYTNRLNNVKGSAFSEKLYLFIGPTSSRVEFDTRMFNYSKETARAKIDRPQNAL